MLLHLRRRLAPSLRAASHPTAAALSRSFRLRALLSTSPTAPFSVEEYLVAACGLTRAQALTASGKLPNLTSASNPDAVLALLAGAGLSGPDIAAAVVSDPLLLRARVDDVGPCLASLRDRLGLSAPQVVLFFRAAGATALRSGDVASRLEFWIPFFGSFDKLLPAVRRNRRLLTSSPETCAKRNISLLQQCGLSVCEIAKMTTSYCPGLLWLNPERVKQLVLRADKLGVPRSSNTFKRALRVASCLSQDKLAEKMEFLRSTLGPLGCSMEKIRDAVCTRPDVLLQSKEKLRRNFDYLRTTFGFSDDKLSAMVCRMPQILELSEEKLRHKIDFFRTTFGFSDDKLSAMVCSMPQILGLSEEKLCRKIDFFRTTLRCSDDKLSIMICRAPQIVGLSEDTLRRKIDFLRATLRCSEENCGIVVCRAPQILRISEDTLCRKIDFLRKTLGCSQDKFSVMFCMMPGIIGLSEERLRCKIEFMVSKVGLELENIVDRPQLLGYSLEKRLVPRHYIVKILQAKGLLKKGVGFHQFVEYSEKDLKRRIGCYMDVVPGLIDAYAAACAGEIAPLPNSIL